MLLPAQAAGAPGRLVADGPPMAQVLFGLDVRSLAAYRIAVGLVVIGDLLDRAHDLKAHYTDQGSPSLAPVAR